MLLGPIITAAGPLLRIQGAAFSGLPVYYHDFPGSLLDQALSRIFPYSPLKRIEAEIPVIDQDRDFVELLPENKAYPIMNTLDREVKSSFKPLYRATIVIAVDRSRISEPVHSWQELSNLAYADTSVGLMVDPDIFMASLHYANVSDSVKNQWIEALAHLNRHDLLKQYVGFDSRSPWPLSLIKGEMKSNELPPLLILFDYQAAQINLRSVERNFEFFVPDEGSLFIDYGLFANGEKAVDFLEKSFEAYDKNNLANDFIQAGYRLSDGRSAGSPLGLYVSGAELEFDREKALGYPKETNYLNKLIRIKDYTRFNYELMGDTAAFRKEILGKRALLPASGEEEQLMLMVTVPIFLLWIFSVYHRLDDKAIKRPMGIMLFWLGVSILMHFAQVMYSNSLSGHIVSYMRFLPIFGMVESWAYTGLSLAVARGKAGKKSERLSWISTVGVYILAMVFIMNDFHGLSMKLNYYRQIVALGPIFYLSLVVLLMLSFSGMRLLLRAQARPNMKAYLIPGAVFAFILSGNLYFFFGHGVIRSGNFDLLNSLGAAVFIEACIATRLIPANAGYFKLFRFSPIKLRLLSADLQNIYPREKADIPLNNLKRIREAVMQSEISPESMKKMNLLQIMFARKREEEIMNPEIVKVRDAKNSDLIYNIGRVSGGYLIWENDISDINRLKNRLSSVTDQLEQQSHMLQKEKSVRSQYVSMNIRRKMLKDIEKSLSDKVDEMQVCLKNIQNSSNDADYVRHELSRVKIMVSQCKRKSNLLVRAEETITAEEMLMILKEALNDAKMAGIEGFAISSGQGELAMKEVLLYYDYLQQLLQTSVDLQKPNFFIHLKTGERGSVLQIIFSTESDIEETVLEPASEIMSRLRGQNGSFSMDGDGKDHSLRLSIRRGETQ